MKRMILAIGFALALTAQVFADVTIKSTGSGKGMGFSSDMTTITYLKGMKMRVDNVSGDTTRSMIFDVENQKMYSFDSKKKEADVFDMSAIGEDMSKVVQINDVKASITPNGKTKQIAGRMANGYDMEISVPATIGGPGGMALTMVLTGPAWIVKGSPGAAEYAAFYKAAAERGWIFSDPRAAKGSPGQAKAIAEMSARVASLGLPYESTMDIKMSGDGPMAGMMARMGAISMTNTVQSVETGTLGADMFAPPAGYKLNQRK
jgi:hypothetical protein